MKESIAKVAIETELKSLELNKIVNYVKVARAAYHPICVYCGFGIEEVLEVAHLDGDRLKLPKPRIFARPPLVRLVVIASSMTLTD